MRHSQFHIAGHGGVVIDPAPVIEHTAVPVVGELVQTGVGHQHRGLTQVLGQIAKGDVEDPVGVDARRTDTVLVLVARHAEKHQPTHAGGHRGCRGPT